MARGPRSSWLSPLGHRELELPGRDREPRAWGCGGFGGIPPFLPLHFPGRVEALPSPPGGFGSSICVFAQALASPPGDAGTKDGFRSTFILRGCFPPPLALFHPTFLSSWSSFPTSSPCRVTGVPSLSEGSLGGLLPFPVPSHGRWEWAGVTPNWELRIFTNRHFSGRKAPGAGRAVGLTAPVPPPQLGSRLGITQLPGRNLGQCPWRWGERNQPWITEESLLEHQELRAKLPRESHTPQTTHPSHCQSSKAPPASLGLMEDSWSSWQGLPAPESQMPPPPPPPPPRLS